MRVNAWASGGFLPPSVRGTTYNGLICGWDWYGTTALLAGVDPHDSRAEAAGLPPVDSHDMTAVLLGTNLTSPRTEIAIGTQPMQTIIYPGGTAVQGIIQRDAETGDLWKLLTGDIFMAAWTGPQCESTHRAFQHTDPTDGAAANRSEPLHDDRRVLRERRAV